MIRSVLKVTPAQFAEIRSKIPGKGKKSRSMKENFYLSDSERSMLVELKELLEMFEFATNEFQTNNVSISRVYPQINSLLIRLTRNVDKYVYTRELRYELSRSLSTRFGSIIDNDVYTMSTFLDPFFNILAFSPPDRQSIINKIKSQVRAQKNYEMYNCDEIM